MYDSLHLGRMIIHPQFAYFQDHLVLETDPLFRIILYWTILRMPACFRCSILIRALQDWRNGFMTKPFFIVAALAVLLAGGLEAKNLAYIFTGTDQFGTIDLDTGAFTQLGNTGVKLSGLGVAQGALYGGQNGGSTLYQVNLADGSLTVVGTGNIAYYDTGSTTKGLYAIDGSFKLYSVDPASGAVTLIGPTGVVPGEYTGMSTNSKSLYLTVSSNLYVLNTTTGAATL